MARATEGIPREADPTTPSFELATLRREAARRRLRPYEILFESDRWSEETGNRADLTITEGWRVGADLTVSLRSPIAWGEAPSGDRSRHFHLHSWFPLGPVLSSFDRTREARFLKFALEVALDWARHHEEIDATVPFAWYDMAVGVRALRLSYLTDAVLRSPFCTDAVLEELVTCLILHVEALADDALFPAHSNHGFYFAAGQAALAARFPGLPGAAAAGDSARARLDRLLRSHFTPEGVHREHSPKYHWMVMDTIEGLRGAGLMDEETHAPGLQRIQDAMAWFVLPNGRLAMFGDSDHRDMGGTDWPHAQTDALRFVLSEGREGVPPAESLKVFPASGYVVVRDGWENGPAGSGGESYLAQAACFHSRTHKHADDLTFIWYDRGHELLVDAGGYGYAGKTAPGSDLWKDGFWYADPRRIYVESTRAHNTVQIDDRNLPRRQVEPYGSALIRAGERGGVYFAESAVRHWDSICHRRILLFHPREWLVVFDWVLDEESAPHHFRQRFHFAPELTLRESGAKGVILDLPGGEAPLHMVALGEGELLTPVRGQEEPELLGWISRQNREMLPVWTSGYGMNGRPEHTFMTLFAFGGEAPEPLPETALTDPVRDRCRVGWVQGDRSHTVSFRRSPPEPFALEYRIGRSPRGPADPGS